MQPEPYNQGMSFTGQPGAPRTPLSLELPTGDIISTYDRYEDARTAVDTLAKSGFPVREVSIVGNHVRSVERITGKLTYGRVALMGALSGAYLGLFLGVLLFLFQPDNTGILGVFIAALVIGAGFGMLFSVVSYSMTRNRRGFSSVTQMIAVRYELYTSPELVHDARRVLMGEVPPAQ